VVKIARVVPEIADRRTDMLRSSARELVFTRNKLIVFTTPRELSHYAALS